MNQKRTCMDSKDWKYGMLSSPEVQSKRGGISIAVPSKSPQDSLKEPPMMNVELAKMSFLPQTTERQYVNLDNLRSPTKRQPQALEKLNNGPMSFIVYKSTEELDPAERLKTLRKPSSAFLSFAEMTKSSSDEEFSTPNGRPIFNRPLNSKKISSSKDLTRHRNGPGTGAAVTRQDLSSFDNISLGKSSFTKKVLIPNNKNNKRADFNQNIIDVEEKYFQKQSGFAKKLTIPINKNNNTEQRHLLYVPPHLKQADFNQNIVDVEEKDFQKQSAQKRLQRLKNEFQKPQTVKRTY